MNIKRSHLILLPFLFLILSGGLALESLGHPGKKQGSEPNRQKFEIAPKHRFIDNGDGTITDRKTNLMWIKNGQSVLGALKWKEAVAFCAGLKYADHSDWRLPSKDEFKSIIDTEYQAPALPEQSSFTNVVTFFDYWTKTEPKFGPGYVWGVNFYYGKHNYLNKKKFAFPWPVRSATPTVLAKAKPSWQKIKTKYIIIRYRTLENLKEFDTRVRYSPETSGLKWLFPGGKAATLKDKIKIKVDALYERVQEILDMRRRMERVAIDIYPDKMQLYSASRNMSKKDRHYRAYYIYKENKIYINSNDLDEKLIAHEIAYSIISNYLPVRPPRASVEILARYASSNLRE